MPWVTGRSTLPALASDPKWRGRSIKEFPNTFWGVGTPEGAAWADGGIEIRVCWADANGGPVRIDTDTVTLWPAQVDDLPFGTQQAKLISVGPSLTTTGYVPERILMPPRGSVSIRVTGIVAVGADHAIIQYWSAQ